MLLATGAAVSLLLSPTTGAREGNGGRGKGEERLADVAAAEEREREREGVRLSERADTGKGAHVRASEGEEGDDVHRRLQRGRGQRGYPPSKGVATDMELIPKG